MWLFYPNNNKLLYTDTDLDWLWFCPVRSKQGCPQLFFLFWLFCVFWNVGVSEKIDTLEHRHIVLWDIVSILKSTVLIFLINNVHEKIDGRQWLILWCVCEFLCCYIAIYCAILNHRSCIVICISPLYFVKCSYPNTVYTFYILWNVFFWNAVVFCTIVPPYLSATECTLILMENV